MWGQPFSRRRPPRESRFRFELPSIQSMSKVETQAMALSFLLTGHEFSSEHQLPGKFFFVAASSVHWSGSVSPQGRSWQQKSSIRCDSIGDQGQFPVTRAASHHEYRPCPCLASFAVDGILDHREKNGTRRGLGIPPLWKMRLLLVDKLLTNCRFLHPRKWPLWKIVSRGTECLRRTSYRKKSNSG